MSDELKPCPFCGNDSPAILPRTCDKSTPYNPNDRAYPVVRCHECGCEKPGADWGEPITAVRNWNNRAAIANREAAPVKESLTTAHAVALPDLWSFLRDVLRQGAAIESQQGQQGYETFIAHIEAEARRQEKKLRAMLAASQPKEKGQ